MKGLHERLVEQLKKYTARYSNEPSGDYEKYEVGMYQPMDGQQRRPSSAQRRESQKRITSGGQQYIELCTCCLTHSLVLL